MINLESRVKHRISASEFDIKKMINDSGATLGSSRGLKRLSPTTTRRKWMPTRMMTKTR
jgi:hypothetical protein